MPVKSQILTNKQVDETACLLSQSFYSENDGFYCGPGDFYLRLGDSDNGIDSSITTNNKEHENKQQLSSLSAQSSSDQILLNGENIEICNNTEELCISFSDQNEYHANDDYYDAGFRILPTNPFYDVFTSTNPFYNPNEIIKQINCNSSIIDKESDDDDNDDDDDGDDESSLDLDSD